MDEIVEKFITGLQSTGILEFIAVFAGIISVWFSKKENILVYPVGLVNTIIYIYLSFKYHLIGEATVNFYYTVMSIYGWYLWSRKDLRKRPIIRITASDKKDLIQQSGLFIFLYAAFFFALSYLQRNFYEGAIPWADGFASASAFTGMWLMARKKVESWWWWIATNIASIPLYFVKGLVFTSIYYVVLLGLAIAGLIEWKKRSQIDNATE